MNYKQMIIVAVGTVAIAWAFLVPSWESYEFADTDQGKVLLTNYESRLFNNPPEQSDVKAPHVVWKYAVHEAIAYVVVAGALCYFLRTRKSPVKNEPTDKPSAASAF